MQMDIGFIGLGTMGEPMALNLIRAGTKLCVWNRSASKCEAFRAAGARVAATPADLFNETRTVILMLADGAAIDSILSRGTPDFAATITGHTIVHMGTTLGHGEADMAAVIRASRRERARLIETDDHMIVIL